MYRVYVFDPRSYLPLRTLVIMAILWYNIGDELFFMSKISNDN